MFIFLRKINSNFWTYITNIKLLGFLGYYVTFTIISSSLVFLIGCFLFVRVSLVAFQFVNFIIFLQNINLLFNMYIQIFFLYINDISLENFLVLFLLYIYAYTAFYLFLIHFTSFFLLILVSISFHVVFSVYFSIYITSTLFLC